MRKLLKIGLFFCFYTSLIAANGEAWIVPDSARVNQYGNWNIGFRVGEGGIHTGGIVKIQFPNCWHTSPWPEGKLKKEQFTNTRADHYITAKIQKDNCSHSINIVREGVDGQQDRFGRSFEIKLEEGELNKGDIIEFSFSNTSAPTICESQEIAIVVDPTGSGIFTSIRENPVIHIKAALPVKMQLIAPSQAVVGREITINVVVLDNWYNASEHYRGELTITSSDTTFIAPETVRFRKEDMGVRKIPVTFQSEGIHTIRVLGNQNIAPHGIESNPIRVTALSDPVNIFWGDLHSHCNHSKDGYGKAETAYRYARDVAALDFYALTDHGAGDPLNESLWSVGLTSDEWKINRSLVDKYNQPGEFITLLACEWSGWSPYGHHNIYYRKNQGNPYGEDRYTKVEEVWENLRAGDAFTIPHHTGLAWWNGVGHNTDWRCTIRDDIRPGIEIYSLWGCSEFYGNEMPYENYHQRDLISNPQPNYARDAWQNGHYIGALGGSDDHNSKPGKEFGGLTAVCCRLLDRQSIFDSIMERHTYATTGQRILLDFTINNELMGSKLCINPDSSIQISIKVVGTETISWFEIVKYDGLGWTTPYRIEPDSRKVSFQVTLDNINQDCLFYVRLQQTNIVGNRRVMAWSSPIWVAISDNPWWYKNK